MLKDKNIVLGVAGGIAAYKSVEVVSRLKKLGANVDVIMTEHAREFVTELTFRTLSQGPVYTDMFDRPISFDVEHISLAEKADLFLLAPATANLIGKLSAGIADDLLTTTVMATRAKVVLAPAMNTNMYLNPITQKNMGFLEQLGYDFISPGVGRLACQTVGPGRMAEPVDIVAYIIDFFREDKPLSGKKVVVTAGPTVEEIDAVRYISNYSSGKMGYEIAKNARDKGAEVVLISGPTNLEKPNGIRLVDIKSTDSMVEAIDREFEDADIIVKSAAVADYKVKNKSDRKLKKNPLAEGMTLELVENIDIARYLGQKKGDRILVGFAAETDDLIENAKKKLTSKNLDFIVANDVSKEGAGFDIDTNIVTIVEQDGVLEYEKMSKSQVADVIVGKIVDLLNKKS